MCILLYVKQLKIKLCNIAGEYCTIQNIQILFNVNHFIKSIFNQSHIYNRPYSGSDRAYFDDTKLISMYLLYSYMSDTENVYCLHRFRYKEMMMSHLVVYILHWYISYVFNGRMTSLDKSELDPAYLF